jgi:hypothetical protein
LRRIEAARQRVAHEEDQLFKGDESLGDYRTPFQDKKKVEASVRDGVVAIVVILVFLPAYLWLPPKVAFWLDPRLLIFGLLLVALVPVLAIAAVYQCIRAVFIGNKPGIGGSVQGASPPDEAA